MSVIDFQHRQIQTLVVPQITGTINGVDQSVEPTEGKLIYDKVNKELFVGDNANWYPVSTDPITLGTVNNGAGNSSAATLINNELRLLPASGINPGIVNNIAQTFSGAKAFNDSIIISKGDPNTVLISNIPTYFESDSSQGLTMPALTYSAPGSVSGGVVWHIQSCGRIVFVGWSTGVAMAITGTQVITCTGIPSKYWSPFIRYAVASCLNNGAFKQCFVRINLDGTMSIFSDANYSVGFSGNWAPHDFTFSYSI